MAHEYTTWAYQREIEQPLAKFVLVCLADAADATGRSFPGQKRLSSMTGMGVRTIRRHLEWLEAHGYVKREERRRRDGTRTSDEYELPPKESTGQIGRLWATGQIGRLSEQATSPDQDDQNPASSTGQTGRLSAPRSTGQTRHSHRPNWPLDAKPTPDPSPTECERVHQPANLAGHEPLTISRTSSPPTPPDPPTPDPPTEPTIDDRVEKLQNLDPLQTLARRDKPAAIALEKVAADARWKFGQKTEIAEALLTDRDNALRALDATFTRLGNLKSPLAYFRKVLAAPEVTATPTTNPPPLPPRTDRAALIDAAERGDLDAINNLTN